METLAEWLVGIINSIGYPGVFIAMFLGNALVPIPIEFVMIPAGYLVQQGEMNFILLAVFGVIGDVCGSLFAYYIALHFGRKVILTLGKHFFFDEKKLAMMERFFASHGEISTLTGRLVPGLRHFMAFPAGFAHMNVKRFAAYTAIGGGLWMAILVGVGYVIGGQKEQIRHYLPYITGTVVTGMAIVIMLYIIRHRRKKTAQ